MRILALCLALLGPASAWGGGLVVVVEAPCFPDDKFHLCEVPIVDGHFPGYLPRSVPHTITYARAAERFAVFVTPNIVPYEIAVGEAASAAAGLCGQELGEVVVARISERERYAPENLESWKFSGTCQ